MTRRGDAGQSIIEFALTLPLLVLLALGVVDVSYALLDLHVATSFSRECFFGFGSRFLSRVLPSARQKFISSSL